MGKITIAFGEGEEGDISFSSFSVCCAFIFLSGRHARVADSGLHM